jgi:hypothetical protein
MARTVGYIILEYNQASGQPDVAPACPYMFQEEHEADAAALRQEEAARAIGRRERYAVAELYLTEDDT